MLYIPFLPQVTLQFTPGDDKHPFAVTIFQQVLVLFSSHDPVSTQGS